MKKLILILFLSIFLVSLTSSEAGGGVGGGRFYCYDFNFCTGDYNICNMATGDCELNMSSFTGCLVQKCDAICKERGKDEGYYYKENKCWCNKYENTKSGKTFSYYSGWIEVKECRFKSSFWNRVKQSFVRVNHSPKKFDSNVSFKHFKDKKIRYDTNESY